MRMRETSPFAAVSAERVRQVCGEEAGWFCRNVLDWTENGTLADLADFLIGKPIKIAIILVLAFLLNRIARRGMKHALRTLQSGAVKERLGALRNATPDALLETGEHSLRAEQRIEALASVLRSIVGFVIFATAAFMILGELGVNLGPLLAGAGIIGVALGFGSQTLVRDFLSGMFILIEDQFGVGDIVDLDQQTSGTVEAVSLRTTRLRAVDGTVWHVPNGEIRRVGNKSQLWSRALLDVEVAHGTDVDHAGELIKGVADEVWKEHPEVLEEPELWGVERMDATGVAIRLVVKTTPAEQWKISRELRRRIKAAFDREGIEVPVWTMNGPAGPAGG